MKCVWTLIFVISFLWIPAQGRAQDSRNITDSLSELRLCPAEPGIGGTFADCTRAKCRWDGETRDMTCTCVVLENTTAVTTGGCRPGTERSLESRYPGVAAIGVCTSATNFWGDCLGVPCGPDADGVTECACRVTTSQNDPPANQYVIVGTGAEGAAEACSSGVYASSATPSGVFQASSVLGSGSPAISWVYP